jgi:acetyl-CoA carboxylase biotin carboxyl carrier protein
MTEMSIEDLKRILEMVRDHDLVEFELEHEGVKLRVRKNAGQGTLPVSPVLPQVVAVSAPAGLPAGGPVLAPVGRVTETLSPPADPGDGLELAVVTSPIVGTFYRASAPGAPAFVEVGTAVKKGQVLCIIEAMKLMNEIESEYDGEIVKIHVDNGQPVQYGERLFAIKAR